jgi:hypothetical protein
MQKQKDTKKFKPHYPDFHTGLLSKGFIFLGFLIIISYLVIRGLLNYAIHGESLLDINELAGWFSLSIIFIVIGIILHFIHAQLIKLGEIAEELHSTSNHVNNKEREL